MLLMLADAADAAFHQEQRTESLCISPMGAQKKNRAFLRPNLSRRLTTQNKIAFVTRIGRRAVTEQRVRGNSLFCFFYNFSEEKVVGHLSTVSSCDRGEFQLDDRVEFSLGPAFCVQARQKMHLSRL